MRFRRLRSCVKTTRCDPPNRSRGLNTAKGPGAMVCPSCRALIARDARDCPYCKAAMPRVLAATGVTQLFSSEFSYSRLFFAANVLVYALLVVASLANGSLRVGGLMGFGTPGSEVLFKVGMLQGHLCTVHGQWWRLFTATFIHLS